MDGNSILPTAGGKVKNAKKNHRLIDARGMHVMVTWFWGGHVSQTPTGSAQNSFWQAPAIRCSGLFANEVLWVSG